MNQAYRYQRLDHISQGWAISFFSAFALLTWGVQQQEPAAVEHLQIALWPEYDRPAMLVIYRFEVALETESPYQVELPIPAAAGQPHAAAWLGEDGALYDADFQLQVEGEWATVRMDIPGGRGGQIEYYAELDQSGDLRTFLFDLPLDLQLGGLSYEVQQPARASNVRVVPAPDSERVGQFGLTYLEGDLGAQFARGAPLITVTYHKSSPALSIDLLEPLGEPAPLESDPQLIPFVAAGLTLIVGIGGAAFLLVKRRSRLALTSQASLKASRSVSEASTIHCHMCGARATATDSYCRNCGTQLRKPPAG